MSAAFTSIFTSPWMWAWSCCPLVRRQDVPLRFLTPELESLSDMDRVYPRYERLAMGGTHSVHIVMSINLQAIGRSLMAGKTPLGQPQLEPIEDDEALCEPCAYTAENGAEDDGSLQTDDEWVRNTKANMQSEPGARAFYGEKAA